ncbi:hypothetical protein [Arthrobacter sp. SX1312]|uniref:hypothetical protein n=1 Tax=Arthrobacter sp. SX1312 TaxID=2058896 RepID=UPI000CE4A83D|nr:hypothetical protein [Arthrobacter sp. SX1312]
MGPTDYSAQPISSITMTKPFSESLSVHIPQLATPTADDLLEDRLKAEPVTFSHPERVDFTWTPAADKGLFG